MYFLLSSFELLRHTGSFESYTEFEMYRDVTLDNFKLNKRDWNSEWVSARNIFIAIAHVVPQKYKCLQLCRVDGYLNTAYKNYDPLYRDYREL